jgi:hypothetical protein
VGPCRRGAAGAAVQCSPTGEHERSRAASRPPAGSPENLVCPSGLVFRVRENAPFGRRCH